MIDLIVDGLATYRLTRLITADVITRRARGAIVKSAYVNSDIDAEQLETMLDEMPLKAWAQLPSRVDDAPMLAEFITCPWCVGMYVSFGVVAARAVAPRLWSLLARALAFSAVAGIVSHAV